MAKAPVAERPYESLFICPPETTQATIDSFMEKVKAAIVNEKGTLKGVQNWGRRRMTYPIKRHKDGIYIYFDFNAGGKAPAAINSLYRVNDFVLRHMTVEREEAPVIPVRTQPAGTSTVAAPTDAAPAAKVSPESPS